MGLRFRWILVIIGAFIVAATYTYPQWRPEPLLTVEQAGFPGLAEQLQSAFAELPPTFQRAYLLLNEDNAMRALELVTAHLSSPGPLPEEEAALPAVENAVSAATGEFGPVTITPEEREEMEEGRIPSMFDTYNRLYADAEGQVIIYQFPDNSRLLRIEDLNIVNGPDLHLALSPNAMPLSGEISELGNIFIDIGPLKSNTGDQNYTQIPSATDMNLNNYRSVVIYDQIHRVVFAVAPLGG